MQNPAKGLRINSAVRESGPVVRVSGEVDLRTSPQMREVLLRVAHKNPKRLIVDLSDVSYMDSSGVGTMVEIKRLVERGGGRLVLAGLQPRVRSVFEVTQLDRFFDIAKDINDATHL
ncbi:MAG: STAS domain-containing protein [Phycisphaerae bacterium]|jgi:anti-sigma B factor antagonist|nr:STAS domain-containing protein [Phycisphaerae bacterium]HOO17507.1 STAS domain-containing protein [Phycisphaerae bacterium]HPC21626.1 STAS domain-containing protein [Phycisphaerae bacterium]HRS29174.1 STAS domain-containing protein [Phycisphaerae bacterium]HRT41336.1 STAS domain-containing protein [Phycisphaerae bacterium]